MVALEQRAEESQFRDQQLPSQATSTHLVVVAVPDQPAELEAPVGMRAL